MSITEIKQAGFTALELRLVVVDYSTISREAAEALEIRAELKRRRGQ